MKKQRDEAADQLKKLKKIFLNKGLNEKGNKQPLRTLSVT